MCLGAFVAILSGLSGLGFAISYMKPWYSIISDLCQKSKLKIEKK
ncbi:hypothetical protein D1AOALGA4SA_2403 [Olavius algarvensis Delta 1 endosymbiont]|nr:hypothetical protein D1AOALGA4SA_2403 [Olavius algarvensis Delta 1 endosymbiont]